MIDAIYVTYGCGPMTLLSIQLTLATTPGLRRIIVVDNGAADEAISHARLQAYLGDRLVYLPRPDNPGVYVAINAALAHTDARFVLIASSDCFPMPGWSRAVLAVLEQRSEYAWMGPGQYEGPFTVDMPWDALADYDRTEWNLIDRPNTGYGIMDMAKLRERVGLFDEAFFYTYGDTDYLARMADAGLKAGSLLPARVIHLVQQSRRTRPAEENVDREMRDEDAFHAKWKDRPDLLALHPRLSREVRLAHWR